MKEDAEMASGLKSMGITTEDEYYRAIKNLGKTGSDKYRIFLARSIGLNSDRRYPFLPFRKIVSYYRKRLFYLV